MKILFSHYLFDDDNPPVRTIQAISHQLRLLGHEVQIHRSQGKILTFASEKASAEGGEAGWLKSLRARLWFARTTARNLAMLRRDLGAIKSYKPDVVLLRHESYCCSMSFACRLTSTPLVVYADAPMAYEVKLNERYGHWHPPGLPETLERMALAPGLAVAATSNPTVAELVRCYGVHVPIRVVPNGLHPERFPVLPEADRRQRRRALGITAPLVAGFQGTFKPFHGIDRLREIMLATARRSDLHWLLIGDGPERKALEEAVSGRVAATFLGRQPPESVGALLNLIDVAVAPHQYDQRIFYLSPLKIIEYAAAECAIVASNQGDIPWLLDDGRAGVILEDPALATWVAAIDRLLDDGDLRRSLGQAARRYVLERFTWRHIAEQYEEVLESTLPHPSPVRAA